ncbi:unnamed protein product [Rhizopus stolonifer]
MDRNVTSHKINILLDSFELYIENSSDDNFQPVITARKRRRSDDFDEPVIKRPLLGESTKSAFNINKSTAASGTSLVSPNPGKPTPTNPTSVVIPVKYSSCSASVDKAGDTKEDPKKIIIA